MRFLAAPGRDASSSSAVHTGTELSSSEWRLMSRSASSPRVAASVSSGERPRRSACRRRTSFSNSLEGREKSARVAADGFKKLTK